MYDIQMLFVYGVLACIASYCLFGYTLVNYYAYLTERAEEHSKRKALRGYLIRYAISAFLFVTLSLCYILIKAWVKNFILLILATGVGVLIAFWGIEERAKKYYAWQSARFRRQRQPKERVDTAGVWIFAVFLGCWVASVLAAALWKFL